MDNDFINLEFMFLRIHSDILGNAIIRCMEYTELLKNDPDNGYYQKKVSGLWAEIKIQRQIINWHCDRMDYE